MEGRTAIFKKKKKDNKEAPEEKDAVYGTAAEEERDTGVAKTGKEDAGKSGLKNVLVMIVVALMAVICAFVFVTRFHHSENACDMEETNDAIAEDSISVENSDDLSVENSDIGEDEVTEKDDDKDKMAEKKSDVEKGKKVNDILGKILVPLDSIVVNLGKVDNQRYLRVIISLEAKSSETEKMIKENKVIFRDRLVSLLSSKSIKDVNTQVSQSELKAEIKTILNSELLMSDDAITEVYFSDFIIQ